jgi:hypothetical protein
MIRNEHAGLGDLYSDASTELTRSLTGEGKWRILVFGTGQALPEERQKYWRSRIQDKYSSLAASGQIDSVDRGDANSAANNGVMLLPSALQYAGDRMAQAAIWRINERTGLKALWDELLAEMQQTAQDTAAGLETELAALDTLYTGMYYISGAVAVDALNRKWEEIMAGVQAGQAMLDQAKTDLDEEGQEKVLAALSPINGFVEGLQGYFGTQEAAHLGAVNLVAIAIVGVALAAATLAAAYIVKQLSHARNVYADQAARMLSLKQDNARGDYDLTKANIEQEYAEGTIDADTRDERLRQAQNGRDLALLNAQQEYEEQQKNMPSAGIGGLSLGLGAMAAVGLVALVLVMRK